MEGLDQFKQVQKESWKHFAPLEAVTTPAAARLVQFANVATGMRVLDVGCGTGVVAVTAARLGAQLKAADLTPQLLERARENARLAEVVVEFFEADVEDLPFNSGEFDVVLSQFGHMFALRPEVAAREMLRVLRPGGTVAFSTWPPEVLVGRTNAIAARYMPPPPPGVSSPILWGDTSVVQQRLGDAVEDLFFDHGYLLVSALSPQHFRLNIERSAGPTIRLVETLSATDPGRLREFRREFDAVVTQYYRDNLVRQDYLMTRARKRWASRIRSPIRLLRDAVLFVLRAQDAVNGIGRAAAGFVVVPDLHLAEQADCEQIQPAEQQAESGHHQRAVRGHHRHVAQEFLYAEPEHDRGAAENAHHTEAAEKMQRARQIAQQKADGQQVEEHAEGARNAVVRHPALAVHIADRHFADGRPMPGGQRRNEAVQFAIERYLLQNVAAVGFERGPEVVDVDAADLGHHPVGDARRDAAHPEIVDAHFAPSADNVVTGRNLFQKQRDVVGIVLQIAIHGDDVLAAGMVETGRQSSGLAEVAAQLDHRYAAVHSCDLAQHGECVIARTIVHQHDFEAFAVRFHDRFQAVVEVGDVLLLIVQRDDDRVLGHSLSIIDRKAVLSSRFSVLSWVRWFSRRTRLVDGSKGAPLGDIQAVTAITVQADGSAYHEIDDAHAKKAQGRNSGVRPDGARVRGRHAGKRALGCRRRLRHLRRHPPPSSATSAQRSDLRRSQGHLQRHIDRCGGIVYPGGCAPPADSRGSGGPETCAGGKTDRPRRGHRMATGAGD